jgi:hypothetical protein
MRRMRDIASTVKRVLPPPNRKQSFGRRFLGTLVFWGVPMIACYSFFERVFYRPVNWEKFFTIAALATIGTLLYAGIEHLLFPVLYEKKGNAAGNKNHDIYDA